MDRLITFTTDFGTRDGYVGAMKGRLLRLAPGATLVDISHEIPPQDILAGAWCLRRAVAEFPPQTLHVAVVDPGVGTSRTALVIKTGHGILIGPDNGLLLPAAAAAGFRITSEAEAQRSDELPGHCFAIDPEAGPWQVSRTFDGLHLFATVAGQLASGLALEQVGPPACPQVGLDLPAAVPTAAGVRGQVLLHDRFGNATTNITQQATQHRELQRVLIPTGAGGTAEARICRQYADLASDSSALLSGVPPLGVLWNSDGLLELFVYGGSAREAAALAVRLERGTEVEVCLANP